MYKHLGFETTTKVTQGSNEQVLRSSFETEDKVASNKLYLFSVKKLQTLLN